MTLLAAFQALLERSTGHNDVAVGTVVAGRERLELEPLIGVFINTLVLRARVNSGSSFRKLLAQVRATTLDAFAHQELPFDLLVAEVAQARDLSRSPLIQVLFQVRNTPRSAVEVAGLCMEAVPLDLRTSKFDLALEVTELAEDLCCQFEYNTDLFDAGTIRTLAAHYERLLRDLVATPDRTLDQLDCWREIAPQNISVQERYMLLQEWNATATQYPRERCIHELFAEQARRRPDAVALVYGDQRLGYGELNARANQLAHHLLALGVGPDVPVGVYLERSAEMVTAVLAVLKAGGAYLPLDPAYPRERIRFMLQDAAAPVVITCEAWLEHLSGSETRVVGLERAQAEIERQSVEDPVNRTRPDQLANIIYTSGSTGVPKGVEVPHRGVTRLVFGCDYARFGPDEVFLQLAPMSFDASTFELWGALLHGATCVLFPERIPSTGMLAEVIARDRVSTLWLTSSLFNAIVDEAPQTLKGVRQLLTGGEALSLAHVRRALEALPETQLINGYGPTESTTFTCCYTIPRSLDPNLARCRSAVRSATPGSTCSMNAGSRSRSAWRGSCTSAATGWRAAIAGARSSPPSASCPIPSAPSRRTPVPHRRPGALSRRRQPRVPRPHRSTGQDPRLPHRAGGDRGGAHAASGRAPCSGAGTRGPAG